MRKLMLLASLALALAAPASAQTMTSQLQACQAIPDAQQRLACYDRISRGQPGVPPAYSPAPYAAPRAAAPAFNPQTNVEQFGEEHIGRALPAHRLQAIVSAITDYRLDLHGKFIVTLENGQTWRQLESDSGLTRLRKTARQVRIERAVFGSYSLTFNDMRPAFKVDRVR